MNKIDIIIPTMWLVKNLTNHIEKYLQCEHINKLILIDNNRKLRPESTLWKNSKVEIVDYGKNIYVNPAWNEGYYRSVSPIMCILNDDVDVDVEIFNRIANLDFSDIDIIGVHLKGSVDNYHIVHHPDKVEELVKMNIDKRHPIGGQAYAWGVCMFVKRTSYKVIPSLYQIWFGDDYLVQNLENIYALKTSKITGEISKTIVSGTKNKNSDIQKRLDLDAYNAYKFNHFLNGKNWDLLRNAYLKKTNKSSNSDRLESEYLLAKTKKSDINENVHILYDLAKTCKSATEFGVRTGVSTRALLNARIKLRSYDIILDKSVSELFDYAKTQGIDAEYIKASTLDVDIAQTDLLFIDTLHTYDQLIKELSRHGSKVNKYIAFHDTYTYGLQGELSNDSRGLLSALIEWMIDNPEWKFKIYKTNNNGFTVLERHTSEV